MLEANDLWLPLTFGLLAISIAAVWTPATISDRLLAPPWVTFFSVSVASGLIAGVLQFTAVLAIGFYILAAYLARSARTRSLQSFVFSAFVIAIALALAWHRLPGFINPVIIGPLRISPGAVLFKQYANFDKAVAGLVLLVFLCKRVSSREELQQVLSDTLPVATITIIAVLGIALSTGLVQLDLKVSQITPIFLLTNLFFTVIAEEAFFRGFLQERLSHATSSLQFGRLLTVLTSALAFGAVHAPGGLDAVLLSSCLGLGCAYSYQKTQRIEAPILIHFLLNTVHFITFTYPQLG